jgi:arylsulfatase A-like enzyme
MRNRLILVFLFGALLLAGAVRVPSAANGASAAARARPNVLFIVMDDLRASIGAYGDATAITPNIDRLARRSLLFTHAYAQQAVCNPSRQSFLSGRRPDSIHVWNLTSHFRQTAPDVVSLPEYFKGQGYVSQGIGKIYHDPAEMQDPQSWSVPATFNVLAKKEDYVLPENQAPPDKPGKKMAASEGADAPDNAYPDGRVADAAVAALGQLKAGGKPFFLAVGRRARPGSRIMTGRSCAGTPTSRNRGRSRARKRRSCVMGTTRARVTRTRRSGESWTSSTA